MKYTTIKTALFILCFGITIDAKSQSYIFTDIGNSILTRPNMGYEYRWKKSGAGASVQWHRLAYFDNSELPQLEKTSVGVRLDLSYKYFFKQPFFVESKLRSQYYKAPFMVNGWRGATIFNEHKSVEFAEKIGVLINRNKKLQFDLSFGIGVNLGSKSLYKDFTYLINKDNYYLSEAELRTKFGSEAKGVAVKYLPHAQLRMFYRIR